MAANCAKLKKNLEYILFKGIAFKFLEIMVFFWLSCNPENFVLFLSFRQGNINQTITVLLMITNTVGENHPSMADSYHTLGVTEHVRCNFPTALKYAQKALSIRLQLYGEDHTSITECYHALGDTQGAMGDYAAALESAKRALSIRRRVFGEEHLSTAEMYHSLGDTQSALGDYPSARALGDYPSALAFGKRAIAIRLKLL